MKLLQERKNIRTDIRGLQKEGFDTYIHSYTLTLFLEVNFVTNLNVFPILCLSKSLEETVGPEAKKMCTAAEAESSQTQRTRFTVKTETSGSSFSVCGSGFLCLFAYFKVILETLRSLHSLFSALVKII